ncbi:Transmembrane protein 147 [Vitis vinifera]|uniref:BOS complex subunit TMEM147 n=1 Tax=Vitis vinifera TaxID=29760 RepID=A0A438ERZ2_VITVI|nr:Transmembrane protein 147 [Vitis vinifera]
MTVFHFFNCAILTFGPHAVYYSATPLDKYTCADLSMIRLVLLFKAALVYLGTALIKLVCLATFLNVSENDSFDPYQELLKALIGFIDVAGLYFALTQLTHRNISQNHKFQAVGLGWAFADSVLHRLAPLWVGARGLEFTWDYILQGLEANANLVLSISLAALGSLMWLRKNKPRTLIPIIYICAGIVATMLLLPDSGWSNQSCLLRTFIFLLPEARLGVAPSKGGGLRTVYLFGDGFH